MIYIIDENDENKRLDKFVSELFENVSRSEVQKTIKEGLVKVNDIVKKPSYSLKENDNIIFDEDVFQKQPLQAEEIELEIVYEDENMLVVNKPSGMLTHPSANEKNGTLVNALLNHYGENLSDIGGEHRKGIVHRLDRNTSGLLMVAKNNEAHEFLQNQIRKKTAIRKYLSVVKGILHDDFDIINKPIARNLKKPQKMSIVEGGRESVTEYNVLERFVENTYVELTLQTGRTHQIRVHMASIGHPVFNDTLYGAGSSKVNTQEQVLMAYKLSFTKPFQNEIIELEIKPDEKIKKVLKYLRSRK